MKTEALAAEAVLLAVEDSVINGHSQGIHFESWDHVFAEGGSLFESLIDYQACEPFTGCDLPSREQVQLIYETYRSRKNGLKKKKNGKKKIKEMEKKKKQ